MLHKFVVALVLAASAFSAGAALRVVRTAPGTVTGVVSYASGQYWITAGKETLCVMVEPSDEPALEGLVDVEVSFSGPIQVWSDRSRCIVVGPDFPKAARAAEAAAVPNTVPVVIGAHGQPDLDACLSIGAIVSPVAVRLAPSQAAGSSARVAAGQEVFMCGSSDDGKWESVVIPSQPGQDCGVSRAVPSPRAYAGQCRSGWVPAEQVEVLAG